MKMPAGPIPPAMFAPCGMNCMVCCRHCAHRRPCAGCLGGDAGKPAHCRACAIKDCAASKDLSHCYLCEAYPCPRVKRLEKSYNTRYGASLVEHGRSVREGGLAAFLERQKARFTCPACGGVVSLHDGACSECGRRAD